MTAALIILLAGLFVWTWQARGQETAIPAVIPTKDLDSVFLADDVSPYAMIRRENPPWFGAPDSCAMADSIVAHGDGLQFPSFYVQPHSFCGVLERVPDWFYSVKKRCIASADSARLDSTIRVVLRDKLRKILQTPDTVAGDPFYKFNRNARPK